MFVTGALYRDDLPVSEGLVLDGMYCVGELGRKRSFGDRRAGEKPPVSSW
jgi:hypothetical protein